MLEPEGSGQSPSELNISNGYVTPGDCVVIIVLYIKA